MKNFLLADSSELMVLRTISASWERKRLIPIFLTWYTSSWRKIFFSPIRANFWLLDSIRPPEPKNVDSYFLHKVYVECMKNFLLADSSELMVLRLISAQKRWFFLSGQGVRRVHEKFSFSPIRASWWLLDSFRPPEPKNVIPSRRRVDRKIFFSPIRASWWLLDSFRPPEPKKLTLIYVVLFWHDHFGLRRVEWKNFLLADSNELMVVRLISASWAKKPLIPTFLTWCTSSWWKIFLLLTWFTDFRTSWWLLDSFRPPEPKNLWFLLFWHDVRRVDEKFFSRRFERADGC